MRQAAIILTGTNVEVNGYKSADGSLTFAREGQRGVWILRRNGKEIDRDRYRSDMAERHNLELVDTSLRVRIA